mgnify:CR=1 FL=1
MVSDDNSTTESTSRRTYLRTAGTAVGAVVFASGTAVAGSDDTADRREGIQPEEVPGDVDRSETQITEPTVITEPGNYRLTEDLSIKSGIGIVIASDNVTLNGAGQTISGCSSGTGIFATLSRNIFVENVTVESLGTGVFYFEIFDSTLAEVTVTDCQNSGIRLDDAARNTVRDCELCNCHLSFSDDCVRNSVFDNTISDAPESGINLSDAPKNVFVRNTVSGSNRSGFITEFDGNHILAQNEFVKNDSFGVDLQDTTDNLVTATNLSDNAGGPCNADNPDDNVLLGNDPECEPTD